MDRMNDDRMKDESLPPALDAALQALVAQAERRAAQVNVERVAARVLDRLRSGEVERRRVLWMSPPALRAAAAVVVLVAAGVVMNLADHSSPPASLPLPASIPAMDSLSSRQLEAVLDATAQLKAEADTEPPAPSGASLDDLTEDQLQTLLASLGGAEG
jgi:hypothetical protein